jgi:hypothetical protein
MAGLVGSLYFEEHLFGLIGTVVAVAVGTHIFARKLRAMEVGVGTVLVAAGNVFFESVSSHQGSA